MTNPATGRKQLSLIPESQSIELGRQAAAEVETTVGLYAAPRLISVIGGVKEAPKTSMRE